MKLFKKTGIMAVLGALLAIVAVQPASGAAYTSGFASLGSANYSVGGVTRAFRAQTNIWGLRDPHIDASHEYGFTISTGIQDRSSDGYCALLRLEVFSSAWTKIGKTLEWTECNAVLKSITYSTGQAHPIEPRYARLSFGRTDGHIPTPPWIDLWARR